METVIFPSSFYHSLEPLAEIYPDLVFYDCLVVKTDDAKLAKFLQVLGDDGISAYEEKVFGRVVSRPLLNRPSPEDMLVSADYWWLDKSSDAEKAIYRMKLKRAIDKVFELMNIGLDELT